jgi:hypothetical protein
MLRQTLSSALASEEEELFFLAALAGARLAALEVTCASEVAEAGVAVPIVTA